ncbi:MAG: lasso peptide biosynthesis B2 protein [Actinobacteria bacterium]|uniref:Unannotated protein n=1 Tax=freshwater metagenome TaxID=449393 RepID=A0A6J6EZS3_9ZZZZ|nr:lasso peptide biosynthesis B2 protein [Actinomycetota bacterium]
MRTVSFRGWTWREIAQVPIVVGLGLVAEVAVRLVPLPRAARLFRVALADHTPPSSARPALPGWAVSRWRVVQRVMRHWPGGGACLRQSLVAGSRLRRLHPTMRLGVARADGRIRAHAWLEVAGWSLDPSAGDYGVLPLGHA